MTKPSIYEQFDKATASFTASALLLDGQTVGRVVVKYGAAATAYVQLWGSEMTKGRALGGGYDRTTAAIVAALRKLKASSHEKDEAAQKAFRLVVKALDERGSGTSWDTSLENAGFTIANVI